MINCKPCESFMNYHITLPIKVNDISYLLNMQCIAILKSFQIILNFVLHQIDIIMYVITMPCIYKQC